MILRRITEQIRSQNWSALGTELLIVVVGVFLGLQAQDWSTARAERSAERAAIERLVVEYQQNLEVLKAKKVQAQGVLAATEELLSVIALRSYLESKDADLARMILACVQTPRFVPTLGSTNSLIASGDLRLIADPEIQKALSHWPRVAQLLIEWQEIERNHSEELILGETFEYLSWPTLLSLVEEGWQVSPLENDLEGLFSSKRFEGLLANRRYNTRASIGRIESLMATTQELIDRLETRLAILGAA